MKRWRAVVFDLDDTLYPEREYVLSGFRAVAEWAEHHLGIPKELGFQELKELFQKGVRGDTFNRWLSSRNLNAAEDLVSRLVEVYRDHKPAIAPFPEVGPVLNDLGKRYMLGLLSDGYLGVQKRKLDALGIGEHFRAIVFSDQLGREAWKPSPRPYEEIARLLGVGPGDAIYVGDNPLKDFLGARKSGMFTIWVRRAEGEYCHHEPPTPEHAPNITVSSLQELKPVLDTGDARD